MKKIDQLDNKVMKSVLNIHSVDLDEFEVIDIREMNEKPRLSSNICKYEHWPLSEFKLHAEKIVRNRKYLFFCQAGVRTLYLINQLHKMGMTNTYSLEGGIFAFQHLVERQ